MNRTLISLYVQQSITQMVADFNRKLKVKHADHRHRHH